MTDLEIFCDGIRTTMARNERENWAWHYGIRAAHQYDGLHSVDRGSFNRARLHSGYAVMRWLDRRSPAQGGA